MIHYQTDRLVITCPKCKGPTATDVTNTPYCAVCGYKMTIDYKVCEACEGQETFCRQCDETGKEMYWG